MSNESGPSVLEIFCRHVGRENKSVGNGTAGDISSDIGNAYFSLEWVLKTTVFPFVALIGNCLSFLVMRKDAIRKPMHFCLAVLAVADTLYVVSIAGFQMRKPFGIKKSDLICKASHGLPSFLGIFANWTVVVITLERLLVILWPLASRTISSIKVVCAAECCIFVLSAVVSSPFLVHFRLSENNTTCSYVTSDFSSSHLLEVATWVPVAFYAFIPVVLVTVANLCIVCKLWVSVKRIKAMSSSDTSTRQKNLNQITRMMLIVSISFIVLTIPICVCHVFDFVLQFCTVALFMGLLNHCINFYLYCIGSPSFRKEFIELVCACCRKMKSSSQETKNGDRSVQGIGIVSKRL